MPIPTIPDHLHQWERYEYDDDLGHHVRHTCARCDDPTYRVYIPGSLRNKVIEKARKERHKARREAAAKDVDCQ